ncbi:MAG: recombination mediator RecR [Pseudomonadota bacterium]
MATLSPLVQQLIEAFRVLPGVGQKTAQRMALYLLERNRAGGRRLAEVAAQAMELVGHCRRCRLLSEAALCHLCQNMRRDQTLLCVVESPIDVFAIEQTGGYAGLYFVLAGQLSPIEGRGPEEVGMPLLHARMREPDIKEVILATSATVEGEATAYYITEQARQHGLKVTRLAQGIALGSTLDFIDSATLARALAVRTTVSEPAT